MQVSTMSSPARRSLVLVLTLALIVSAAVVAAPGRAAPTLRRLAGRLAYYNPVEVKVSGNGRYVVFTAFLTKLPGENTNIYDNEDDYPKGFPLQVVLFDLRTGTETVVSHTPAGKPADGNSMLPAISDDGRSIVFASDATDLVAGDTNGIRDVFLYSTATGAVERLSVDTRGHELSGYAMHHQVAGDLPTISGDGSTVAFVSDGNVTLDSRYRNPQSSRYVGVFVRTLHTGKVLAVTDVHGHVARTTEPPASQDDYDGDGPPFLETDSSDASGVSRPALSRDGRMLAFAMSDPICYNPHYADFGFPTSADADVFIRDLKTRRTVLASPRAAVTPCNKVTTSAYYSHVVLDASGRHCLFTRHGMISGTLLVDSAVFLFDGQSKMLREVSAQPTLDGGALHEQSSGEGALSASGTAIAFASGPARRRSVLQEPYLETPALIYRVDSGLSGSPAVVTGDATTNTETYRSPSLSADGHVLAFITSASLSSDDPGSANGPSHDAREDVYVQIV